MSQADFEKSYAELRKPLKMKPLGKAPSLESTVRAGDVETIERILAGGKLEKFRNDQEYPASVTYAMAHWLVDNSGRADLARRWMEATDHTPDLAAKHFEKLTYGDVWQKLVLQRCLGMSTLVDIFSFTPQHGDAPYHELLNLDQDPRRYAATNTLLASILRMNHPELPPDVSPFGDAARQQGRREPLIHHLWTAMSADKHLPSIGMAYGTQNPEIRRQMGDGIKAHLATGRFSLLIGSIDRMWEMFEQWGSPDVGQLVWHSKNADTPFVVNACKWWNDKVAQRMGYLLSTGVDIDEFVNDSGDQGNNTQYRILDAAVFMQKPDALVWLLDHGADPAIVSRSDVPAKRMTVLRRAEMMLNDHLGDDAKADNILTILRATLAKTAARQALAELSSELGVEMGASHRLSP